MGNDEEERTDDREGDCFSKYLLSSLTSFISQSKRRGGSPELHLFTKSERLLQKLLVNKLVNELQPQTTGVNLKHSVAFAPELPRVILFTPD